MRRDRASPPKRPTTVVSFGSHSHIPGALENCALTPTGDSPPRPLGSRRVPAVNCVGVSHRRRSVPGRTRSSLLVVMMAL